MADHIAVVVKSGQVVHVRPTRTDHGDADRAPLQRVVNLVPPLAHSNAVDIAEDVFPSKRDAQPVVQPPARPPRVVTTIADEDMVTTRRLRATFIAYNDGGEARRDTRPGAVISP